MHCSAIPLIYSLALFTTLVSAAGPPPRPKTAAPTSPPCIGRTWTEADVKQLALPATPENAELMACAMAKMIVEARDAPLGKRWTPTGVEVLPKPLTAPAKGARIGSILLTCIPIKKDLAKFRHCEFGTANGSGDVAQLPQFATVAKHVKKLAAGKAVGYFKASAEPSKYAEAAKQLGVERTYDYLLFGDAQCKASEVKELKGETEMCLQVGFEAPSPKSD